MYDSKDKVADASAVSIRPLYKIEDRLRSKHLDTTSSLRISRAVKEQTRVEDTVEVNRTISSNDYFKCRSKSNALQ